jgi:hypothetical protein
VKKIVLPSKLCFAKSYFPSFVGMPGFVLSLYPMQELSAMED